MDFESIYRQYFKDVYIFLLGLTSNDDIAQEITQETFVKALKAIDSFDGSKDIRAWLFTIAKNSYFTYLKRQSRFTKQSYDENSISSSPDMEGQLIDEESTFLIHQFLHTMEEPYKEVFSLRVFGELPFEKIGILFGKSSNWARVTYYRAKKKIQDYMEVLNCGQDNL